MILLEGYLTMAWKLQSFKEDTQSLPKSLGHKLLLHREEDEFAPDLAGIYGVDLTVAC